MSQARLILCVLLPFAAGYYLSFLFRSINAVIAGDLSAELGLGAADLGLLTSAYFLLFVVVVLPCGVLLDRYGPRLVDSGLLLLAAAGSLVFALADGVWTLMLGRALIGMGVAVALIAGLKAIVLWLPPERVALANGWYIMLGALGAAISSLVRAAEWAKTSSRALPAPSPEGIPFTREYIDGLFRTFMPCRLKVTRKTLDNARSHCRFVQEYYGLARGRCWTQLTPKLQQVCELLPNAYRKIELKRLLVFAASRGMEPDEIEDSLMPEFRAALESDPSVRSADAAYKRALRAWNWAASQIKAWPQQRLTVPRSRKVWGKPWSYFPESLRAEAQAFLERRRTAAGLFAKGQVVRELRESTIKTQLEQVRQAACALIHAGIAPEELTGLRSILSPEWYKAVFNILVARTGGKVTRSIKHPAMVLTKMAASHSTVRPGGA